ncbi:pilus assembly protein PilY [Verminephrobacter eiseniae]|nr:pilus assembly protein PilY [Verminephrobacter eiseniae]MCW5236624.1 pilus assembly protein PilY [Verminephrobacter eiseniae]
MMSKPCRAGAPGQSEPRLRPPPSPATYLTSILLPIALGSHCMALGNEALPTPKAVALANTPLHAAPPADKPALLLALSVEFPTVGAQYTSQSAIDDTYTPDKEYLGYYDAQSCYEYNDARAKADKRFERTGPATNRRCANAFSGNFLNWASGSAIDMLRLALSGGDRHIDTPALTVLQRAMLPGHGNPQCMWNHPDYFPAKHLRAHDGTYHGALPLPMIHAAGLRDIHVANMLDRIYFRAAPTTAPEPTGSCDDTSAYDLVGSPALNSDGYFYARVRVCDADSSGKLQDQRDYPLCQQYPGGNYKPTGVIQKYSDQLRLAAFGYLLDNADENRRYGGVMRAPMKYVGTKTYDINGQISGNNAHAEWDKDTGVFIANPGPVPGPMPGTAPGTPAISGVINYLNKFGRTGAVPGLYKEFDPVGELYYEALRYLQGLAPDPRAIAGVPADGALADGYPVYTQWDDPYGAGRTNASDYSCVKSHILLVGGIHTHEHHALPGPDAARNIPDIDHWREAVKNFEIASGNPHTGHWTFTKPIIGLAYWARTNDIRGAGWSAQPDKQRPGLRVKTWAFDVNEAGLQSDAATRRTRNQFFMAAKYGGFETALARAGPHDASAHPFRNRHGQFIDDVWQKPDQPGEASAYHFLDPAGPAPARGLLGAFEQIFYRASMGMRSAVGAVGARLNTGSTLGQGSVMYSARFDTGNWSGDVVAEPIGQNASQALEILPPLWRAAQQLDRMPASRRNIHVGRPGRHPVPVATRFTRDDIDPRSLALHFGGAAGADRIAYLRGDRSKEGAPFRLRSSLLGDIVNSNISYSGPPSNAFTGAGYADFRRQYGARTPAVFVGANDGMLHAFDANTGDELFAYIPSWLVPRLSALTEPGFRNNHQSYVDAPSVVAQAWVGPGNSSARDWKTVLVSGTGAGGAGVFALDVSDPARFDSSSVMWEFTRADDPDMGQVLGSPRIMKIRTNAPMRNGRRQAAVYRWFAVVGSGVNNHVPDVNQPQPGSGRPALFLLALDKPAGQAWLAGHNYFKVSLPTDPGLARTDAPGLANFSALYGIQGEVTDIYMGDLHGKLWRLQFAGKGTDKWSMNGLSFFDQGTAASPAPYPLYSARSGDGQVQPIFAAPAVFVGPLVGGVETFYVVVGTGKHLEVPDNASTIGQSVYAIYDNGSTRADASPAVSAIAGRGRLQQGVVDTGTQSVAVRAFRWGRPHSDADVATRAGWFFDLPVSGERIDQAALDLGDLSALVHSKIPPARGSGACPNALGGGNRYYLTIGNAKAGYVASPQGLLGPAVVVTSDHARVTAADSTRRRLREVLRFAVPPTHGGAGAGSGAALAPVRDTVGRLSWQRIFNYQELKSTADKSSASSP